MKEAVARGEQRIDSGRKRIGGEPSFSECQEINFVVKDELLKNCRFVDITGDSRDGSSIEVDQVDRGGGGAGVGVDITSENNKKRKDDDEIFGSMNGAKAFGLETATDKREFELVKKTTDTLKQGGGTACRRIWRWRKAGMDVWTEDEENRHCRDEKK